jgi:teichuronic acid exporter
VAATEETRETGVDKQGENGTDAPAPNPEEMNAQEVRSRSVAGAKALGLRTLFSLLLRFASIWGTSRLLGEYDFGLFFTASNVAGVAMYFGDVGMAAYLVAASREPTRREMATAFWTQQILTATMVVGILLAIPFLLRLNNAPAAAGPLIAALAVALFLSSLRLVPTVALERSLRFDVLARLELAENVVQVVVTLGSALLGARAWSFVLGAVAGRVVSLVMVFLASPWRVAWGFDREFVKQVAGTGLVYHANGVVPTVIAGFTPAIMNRGLGVEGYGAVGWAMNLSSLPIMLSGVLNRIAFPAYSRLQGQPDEMGRALETAIRRVTITVFLALAPVVILAPLVIPLILGTKWAYAIPVLQWLLMHGVLMLAVNLLAQAQQATRPTDRLWTILISYPLRLLLLYLAIRWFGLVGAGAGTYVGTVLELALSAWLVWRNTEGCSGLVRNAVAPALILQAILGVSFAVAMQVTTLPVLQHLVTLALCVALTVGYDRLTPRSPVTTEVTGMVRLLAPRLRSNP